MMAFPNGTYHADSDADDEYERSVIASPNLIQTDSEASPSDSEPPSAEHTPTTFGISGDDRNPPRTIITEWTADECANFVANLGLRQYCDAFIENDIIGEALVALKHEELKEMGIASAGHRLTILKNVYETKISQDIPIDPDHYIPLSAEHNARNEMATKDDIHRLAKSIIKLRDERMEQAEAELRKLADDYRRLRQELLPVFKMAKENSEPLPYAPFQAAPSRPDLFNHEVTSPPPPITQVISDNKTSLTRSLSKKLFLGSTPKTNSPTHLPNTIHEGKTFVDNSSLDPSAAATAASNHLTASMSGGSVPNATSPGLVPSPTSPLPYHQTLASRSYANPTIHRYDGTDDQPSSRPNLTPTPPNVRDREPNPLPNSMNPSLSSKANPANNTHSTSTTSATFGSSNSTLSSSTPTTLPPSSSSTPTPGEGAPSVEIFKSFRVGLDDPCYKVLPAALRKYNIQADWRHYALYIVYGDQERCVGLEEKPLALFKDLDREGKRPMFMLRRLAPSLDNPPTSGGLKPAGLGGGGAIMSSAASVRTMGGGGMGANVPGGVL